MGVALSLWPDAGQSGGDAAETVAEVNQSPSGAQAEQKVGQTAAVGAALIQEARDVNIQDQANVNVVGGDQTFNVNHTVINIANGGDPETAIQIIRENLDPAKYPSIQQDVYDNRAKGSGLWFLGTPEFKRWWRKEGRVLWATGMPGAGKTHVAACSIHHALQKAKTTDNVAVCYGYFQYSDPKPTVKVLQALVRQQAEYCPPGAELVAATIKERKREGRELSEADCIDLLKYMCERIESWFYLDALDESPHDAQFDFVELCATIPAQVCIFSRPLMDMRHHLQEFLGECGVTFATIVAQDGDIELLVNHKIDSTPKLRRLLASQPGLRERISRKIIENACGMFVHAALQIESIRHTPTIARLELKLTQFPRGLDGMYAETMKRINEQPEDLAQLGRKVLLWVAYAERQLTVEELQRALATDDETEEFDKDNIPPEDSILATCCGLVTLTSEGELRLVHMTALEAVRNLLQQWFPFPDSDLARVCMATLIASGIASGSMFQDVGAHVWLHHRLNATLSRAPLLEYAHTHFARHLRRGMKQSQPALRERALAFLHHCTSFPLLIQVDHWTPMIDATPIHVAAYCAIPDLLHSVLQQDQLGINVLSLPSCEDRLTPLMVASVFGNVETAAYILNLPDVDPNYRDPHGWTALHWAAVLGSEGVISCLFNSVEVDRNATLDDGWTPLMMAISWYRESVALRLLGTPGITLTTVSTEGDTPLLLAIERELPQLALKILDLEPRLDPNIHANRSGLPLVQAAGAGYGEVVEQLLAHPGICLVHPSAKHTPLTSALASKHPDIARQLLAFPGVDAILDAPGGWERDWTPLMYASKEGYVDIVKQIVGIGRQHGMNPKRVDKYGSSALTIALDNNHAAVARLLVEEDLGVGCWNESDIQTQFVRANLIKQWGISGDAREWVLGCLAQLQQWVQDGCPSKVEFKARRWRWQKSQVGLPPAILTVILRGEGT